MTTGQADVVRVSDAAQPPGLMAKRMWSVCPTPRIPTTNGPADVVRVPDAAQPPRLIAQRTWSACPMLCSPHD